MAQSDEWFRSGDWDEAAQAHFEAKLARAHEASRAQYLRIKGLGLSGAGETEAARNLFLRVLADHPDEWGQVKSSKEHLADLARAAGRVDEAVFYYRQVLEPDGRPPLSSTSGAAHLALAEVYLEKGEAEQALQALNYVSPDELGMNSVIFRWNVVLAEVSLRLGEHDVSRAAARRALALLDAPDQFSRHPGVGKADADRALVARLKKLADADDSVMRPRLFKRPRRGE